MSGLKNTIRRLTNVSRGKGYQTNQETRQKKAAAAQAGKDAVFANAQMPDEETIRRTERKKQARRVGSRASTVLTDRDTLG